MAAIQDNLSIFFGGGLKLVLVGVLKREILVSSTDKMWARFKSYMQLQTKKNYQSNTTSREIAPRYKVPFQYTAVPCLLIHIISALSFARTEPT